MHNRCSVLTMDVDITNLDKTSDYVKKLVSLDPGAYVCVSNVQMCMETFDSDQFRSIVNNADLVIPDGRPIFWAQKLLGAKGGSQVRGMDIMSSLCSSSLRVGLYGGSSDSILHDVVSHLKSLYPNITIVYSFFPPFRSLTENEDLQVVTDINNANVDVLFMGIGCPKQEKWMADHKDKVHCVMLGVGAAFDFIAGSKRYAPYWLQFIGCEWLFRLCSEPTRLWRRYLIQNPRFVLYLFKQIIIKKIKSKLNCFKSTL